MIHELQASAVHIGLRLDVWLEQSLEGCSRSLVTKQIKAGRCQIEPGKAKASWKLRGNEKVTIEVPEMEKLDIVAESIDLDVLYEDDVLVVVNKAPGMVVHPAVGHTRGTLLNALMGYAADAWQPLLVHRLDADTSGLILVAKNQQTHAYFQEQFKERKVYKKYLALCHGQAKADYFEHHGWIGRHPKDFRKRFVYPEGYEHAKQARSDFWVRERHPDYCVLEVRIHTGRTHQIRVHLQDKGHPLLADATYGRSNCWPLNSTDDQSAGVLRRHGLHAWQLRIQHPSGELLELSCPIPADLAHWLQTDLKPLDGLHG